ncbi:MAG: FAD-dependent 5-carboxymethylaminomethyl-2-thiouridine(34) oxidoreductase MnmC [Pseudomonadota bacterium]
MVAAPWFEYDNLVVPHEKRATILGGGLAGTSVAYALASRGWEITLIERNAALASAASGNPSGVVMPAISRKSSPPADFSYAAFQYALEHFQQLRRSSSNSFFHPIGVIQVSDSAPEFSNVIEKRYSGLRARVLDLEQFQTVTGLGAGRSALYFPTAGWANPVDLCSSQIASVAGRISIKYECEIIHLQQRDEGWSVFNREEEIAMSPVVIIANGVDANRFAQTSNIPVTPVRGQISFVESAAFEKSVSNVICSNRGYVIPDRQDTMSVGATYEPDTMTMETTQYSHRENLRNLQTLGVLGKGYVDCVLGGRAAIRTTTADRLPIVGGVPDFPAYNETFNDLQHGRPAENYSSAPYHPGLYIAGGFGSRGITHCPYSGELLARLISGELRDHERDLLALLHPARFEVRRLKRMQPRLEEEIGAVV